MPNDPTGGQVAVEFTLRLERGEMRVALPVPEQEVTLTDLLPILQHFTSGVAQRVADGAAQEGQPVQCGPRCSACCHQLVPISFYEAEFLGRWIRSLPVEQQAALAGRFQQALLALQQKGVLSRLNPEMFDLSTEEFAQMGVEYFMAGVPCPFLVDDNCSIHPIRPLICREYMVVSPPEYCAEPGHKRALVVVQPVRPSRALIKLGSRAEEGSKGWLPLVFLISWLAAAIDPAWTIDGPGPAVLREFVRAL